MQDNYYSDDFNVEEEIQIEEPEAPVHEPYVAPVKDEPARTKSVAKRREVDSAIRVQLLSQYTEDGRVAVHVVGTPSEVYLVLKEEIEWTYEPQMVSVKVIDQAVRPQNWEQELDLISLTKDEARLLLYKSGKFAGSADDAFSTLVKRGKFPISR